jgi:sporulation protein YlmC with PRC-barrel domain
MAEASMLRNVQDLEGYAIRATDGKIGHVKDFYVDDKNWAVRYLVVETGSWLSSRKVLLSPFSIGHPDWSERTLPVSITKEHVKNSPAIDADQPLSRHQEMQYLRYYGYPYYWDGTGLWGAGTKPGAMLRDIGYEKTAAESLVAQADPSREEAETEQREQDGDSHLCSCKVLLRYHIEASDGGMGQVKGLLVDEHTWAIRYLIVETSNWWFGHEVLISPRWIQEMSWPDATIAVNLTRQAVKDAPSYDPSLPLSRDQEMHLHQHHGHSGYWADEVRLENPEYHVISPAGQETIVKTRDGVMQDTRQGS